MIKKTKMKPPGIKILMYIFNVNLSLIFIALLLLLEMPAVNADQVTNVNITVAQQGSAEMTFSINPTTAYQNQDIDFIITAQNTGNLAISAQPEIKIYRDAVLIANLTIAGSSISVGGNVTFIATWNTGSNATGSYTANASLYCDNETLNSTQFFTIANKPATSFGGGAWLLILPKANVASVLEYAQFPVLAEVRPGEALLLDVVMKNSAGIDFSNLSINISGVPEGWIDPSPASINIPPNSTLGFRLYTSLPLYASPGDYKVAVNISNAAIKISNFFILRVKPYPPEYSIPTITRIVTIDLEKQVANVHLKVANDGEFINALELIESIPKSIAREVKQIHFVTSPEILESDPVVKWTMDGLVKRETRVISYSIEGISQEYFSYVYWPLKQVNVIYKNPELINVSSTSPESIAPGETGEIQLTITNFEIKPVNATAEIEAPVDWTISSREIKSTVPAKSLNRVTFSVTPPSDARTARYDLKLRVTYDSGETIENISILVQPRLPLYYIMLALILIILISGALYLKRREYPHKNK